MRFSIRDVLWLTTLIAVALGWYATWSTLNKLNSTLRDENARLVLIGDEAVAWKRSANEQRLRADFVSEQLHAKRGLHRPCPSCGTLVQFPPLESRPWTPPKDSIWVRESLIP